MVRTVGQTILKFLHAPYFQKNTISKCEFRLLDPLKQPHLKMKMFFERETLNPNNEKYLAKTIGYKLWYTVYDSTNTTIANLISLANIETRVKFQLLLSLVL